jgi:putative DNA primase/helicase
LDVPKESQVVGEKGASMSIPNESGPREKPAALRVQFDGIPMELKRLPRWVVWRYEFQDGKWKKPPVNRDGQRVDGTNPENWWFFEAAKRWYELGHVDGIGFALTTCDSLVGVDLDDVREPVTGELVPWAAEIVQDFSTYSEVSPSQTGVKLICKGKLPRNVPRPPVELYHRGHYFTITGHRLMDMPATSRERQGAIDRLLVELQVDPAAQTVAESFEPFWLGMTDAEVIKKLMTSNHCWRIRPLWVGGWERLHLYGGDHSRADFALLQAIGFYSGACPAQIDNIFRKSSLMRPKWDSPRGKTTVGSMSIRKLLSQMKVFYRHGKRRPVEDYAPGPLLSGPKSAGKLN